MNWSIHSTFLYIPKQQRNWDYEPISVHFETTDASKINVISKVVRVSRYDYAISANLTNTEQMDETTMASVKYSIYYSQLFYIYLVFA